MESSSNAEGWVEVEAVHPHWKGAIRLSSIDNSLVHRANGNRGTYSLSSGTLVIAWENFPPDTFIEVCGTYLHRSLVGSLPELDQLRLAKADSKVFKISSVSVGVPPAGYPVTLRIDTSDIATFHQIFVGDEYDSASLPASARTIVDLGANIGLATVFFAQKFPDARILAVEPEDENFALLAANTARLGSRVSLEHAAVWSKDGFVSLHTKSQDGSELGAWGVQVSDHPSSNGRQTACYRLSTLLEKARLKTVDILKVDIEGAELELFSQGSSAWLEKVGLLIIETHDRFRPGSESAVRRALQTRFEELPRSGENLFFRGKKA